jgi:allose kinase
MENDTVMLLSNDVNRLSLPGGGVVLGVYIGTGLGSCVFIDGKPYKGRNGFGSELGHVPLLGKTRKCGCGNVGCAEAYVSGSYLQLLRSERYPDTEIGDIFTAMAANGELDEYAETLAVIIAGAVQMLDPDVIILGGGVAAMKDFPFERFKSKMYDFTMKPLPAENLNIRLAPPEHGIPSGVRGAMIYARTQYETRA